MPLEAVLLSEIWVRGELGKVTVWWTQSEGGFDAVKTDPSKWTQVRMRWRGFEDRNARNKCTESDQICNS